MSDRGKWERPIYTEGKDYGGWEDPIYEEDKDRGGWEYMPYKKPNGGYLMDNKVPTKKMPYEDNFLDLTDERDRPKDKFVLDWLRQTPENVRATDWADKGFRKRYMKDRPMHTGSLSEYIDMFLNKVVGSIGIGGREGGSRLYKDETY